MLLFACMAMVIVKETLNDLFLHRCRRLCLRLFRNRKRGVEKIQILRLQGSDFVKAPRVRNEEIPGMKRETFIAVDKVTGAGDDVAWFEVIVPMQPVAGDAIKPHMAEVAQKKLVRDTVHLLRKTFRDRKSQELGRNCHSAGI